MMNSFPLSNLQAKKISLSILPSDKSHGSSSTEARWLRRGSKPFSTKIQRKRWICCTTSSRSTSPEAKSGFALHLSISSKWMLGVRYQYHHHLPHDIINHHLVYCSRFTVYFALLGKKAILSIYSFMIFSRYPQNVGRRSYRGTPPETPPIADPDICIQAALLTQLTATETMSDHSICPHHKLYQSNLDIKILGNQINIQKVQKVARTSLRFGFFYTMCFLWNKNSRCSQLNLTSMLEVAQLLGRHVVLSP